MSDGEEEMVAARLGDDYYQGAYFVTKEDDSSGDFDYLIPRSQMEHWEAAKAAYEAMQSEIEQVMEEQCERIRALNAQRPETPLASFIKSVYANHLVAQLRVPPTLRGPNYKEDEDDTPWLVTDAKIDRWEEEQGL